MLRADEVVGAPVEVELEYLVFSLQWAAREDTNIIRQCPQHVQLLRMYRLLIRKESLS